MRTALALVFILTSNFAQEAPLPENEAVVLQRRDRADDLNLPFEDAGFAVVRVKLSNPGPASLSITASQIRFLNPKGKEVPLAVATDIVPKMLRSGVAIPRLDADVGGYRGPTYGRPMNPTIISSGSRAGVVDVGRVERLKKAIEKHQLQDTTLEPGAALEGVVYVKTKEPPDRLTGSRVVITPDLSLTVK